MQKMEGELNVLSGEDLKKQYYELAVRYAQASFTGDCWFLMRDCKSVIDTVRVNEVDLAAKALEAVDSQDYKDKRQYCKERTMFDDCCTCINCLADECEGCVYDLMHKGNQV
jgi:hypothetical protein